MSQIDPTQITDPVLDRRSFLRGTAAAAVGVPASSFLIAGQAVAGESLNAQDPKAQVELLGRLWDGARCSAWLEALESGAKEADTSSQLASNEPFWELVRGGFLLEQPFLNCGSYSPSAQPTLRSEVEALLHESIRPSSHSMELEQKAIEVREALAAHFHVPAEDLFFTANTTHGCHIIAEGLELTAGDEVVMTNHEHSVAAHGFKRRAEQDGVVIKTAVLPEADTATPGSLVAAIAGQITEKTKAVAIPHIPYTNGYLFPIKEIAELCKAHKVFLHVDGAHGPGMLPIDLKELGVDSYACNGHKWMLGPKATGMLYIRDAESMGIDHSFIEKGTSLYNEGTGTRDVTQMIALGEALKLHQTIGEENVWARIQALRETVREVFGTIPQLTPYSSDHPELKSGVVTFWIDGAEKNVGKAAKAAKACLADGVTLKGLTDFGTPLIRLTPHMYVSQADIERAAEVLASHLG